MLLPVILLLGTNYLLVVATEPSFINIDVR